MKKTVDKHVAQRLAQDEITIPQALYKKRSRYAQLVHYMASPAIDPLAPATTNASGLFLLKLLPVPAAVMLACMYSLV